MNYSKQLIFALAFMLMAGCSTMERGTYQVLGTTAATVDAAMKGWGDYVRAGKATTADEATAMQLYAKYQGAMRVAKAAVLSLKKNEASTQADWEKATQALQDASGELIGFIGTFISTKETK